MKKPQKKQIVFAIIIVVVVGLSVTVAVFFSQYQASIQSSDSKEPEATTRKPVVEKKANDALKKAYEGDVSGGVAELEQAIEDTGDQHEKHLLYSYKATLLYNGKDLSGALAAAIKAYGLEQTSDSAALVGQFSRELGNKPQAIEYYKKAIERIDKTDPYWDEDTEYYNSVVKELEGGVKNG